MRFADIPGHEAVKDRLRRMADSGHVPHALLLEGPAGSGKFALARAFASYIHCTDRRDGDSCGQCAACRQGASFNHLDTVYSFPVLKRSSKPTISDDWLEEFKVFVSDNPFMDFDQWRAAMDNANGQPQIFVEEGNELLRRLSFKTRGSAFKTVLMWLPERLQESAANKLLKMVEEAYADTIFIMTSDRPRAILPTIYSRTQRIEVPRLSDAEVASVLETFGIASPEAAEASLIAGGNVNEGLTLARNSHRRQTELDLFVDLMRKAYGRKVQELRLWSQKAAEAGRESTMAFLAYCTRLMRESLMMHLAERRLLCLTRAEAAFLVRFYPFINERNVLELVALFDRARTDIGANANAKIVLFDLAVRTIILIRRK